MNDLGFDVRLACPWTEPSDPDDEENEKSESKESVLEDGLKDIAPSPWRIASCCRQAEHVGRSGRER